jgi:hypothetical protein
VSIHGNLPEDRQTIDFWYRMITPRIRFGGGALINLLTRTTLKKIYNEVARYMSGKGLPRYKKANLGTSMLPIPLRFLPNLIQRKKNFLNNCKNMN